MQQPVKTGEPASLLKANRQAGSGKEDPTNRLTTPPQVKGSEERASCFLKIAESIIFFTALIGIVASIGTRLQEQIPDNAAIRK